MYYVVNGCLDVSANRLKLDSMCEIPTNVDVFRCAYNFLTKLPELHNGIITLDCHHNILTSLPELPDEMKHLICYNNKLEELPKLPSGLEVLSCSHNNITSLHELPESLSVLTCDNNPIENLIPIKFVVEQRYEWIQNYYFPYIRSYKGQKNILTKYPNQCADLLRYCNILPHNSAYMKDMNIMLLDEIKEEFSYLIQTCELNLI